MMGMMRTKNDEIATEAVEEQNDSLIMQLMDTVANRKGSDGMAAAAANSETDFDKAFAAELNEMSLSERERALEDIHGVSPLQEESEDVIALKLQELEKAIDQSPKSTKIAYDKAMETTRGRLYLTSRRYQMQFLRAESFDVGKAAKRLLLHAETKTKYYGEETAGRPLRLTDLNAHDLKELKSGNFAFLPRRDRSGRMVVFDKSAGGDTVYPSSLLSYYKAFWYALFSTLEDDEETQKRGMVLLVWWVHGRMRYHKDFDTLCHDIAAPWLPIKPAKATHICIESGSPLKAVAARFAIGFCPPEIRYSMRIHQGSFTEIQYALSSFGIPVDDIPVTHSGGVKTKELQKWVERRHHKEMMLAEREQHQGEPSLMTIFMDGKIDLPSNQDVLLGVGKPVGNHLGNKAFRNLVELVFARWDSCATNAAKKEMSWEIVRHVQRSGGRFLQRNQQDNWWEVASDKDARDKAGKTFNNMRKSKKQKALLHGNSNDRPWSAISLKIPVSFEAGYLEHAGATPMDILNEDIADKGSLLATDTAMAMDDAEHRTKRLRLSPNLQSQDDHAIWNGCFPCGSGDFVPMTQM